MRVTNNDSFILQARNIHGDNYEYPENYLKSNTKIKIICPTHGEFSQRPNGHLTGNGCPKCSENVNLTTEEFIVKSRKVHGNIYNYSKTIYVLSRLKVSIICPEHGIFTQTPNNHLQGKGCVKCVRITNQKDLIEEFKEVHGNYYDYSLVLYKDSKSKLKIICSKHGVFYQTSNNHLNGKGCPKCSGSNYERKVNKFVSSMFNLRFKTIRPEWLKGIGKRALEIDMFNSFYKFGIEYQGEQHYLRNVNDRFSEEGILEIKKRDAKKLYHCRKNGVCLIRISCFDWKKLETPEDIRSYIIYLIKKELSILYKRGHRNLKIRNKL